MTHLEMFRQMLDASGTEHEVEYEFDGEANRINLKIDVSGHSEYPSTVWATFDNNGDFILFDVVGHNGPDEPLTGEPPK